MKNIESTLLQHRHRGKTSSRKENEKNLRLYRDLISAFERISYLEEEIKKLTLLITSSSDSFSKKIKELEQEMEAIEDRFRAEEHAKGIEHLTLYSYANSWENRYPLKAQDETYHGDRAIIMTDCMIAQPEVSSKIPKTYIEKENGEYHIPKQLEIELIKEEDLSQSYKTSHNELHNMLNEKDDDFFIYDIEYNTISGQTKASEITFELTIPLDIAHQKKINYIRINTYPLTSTRVSSIKLLYRGLSTEVATLHKGNTEGLGGQLKFNFEDQYVERVQVTLSNKDIIRLIGKNSRRLLGSNLFEVGYELTSQGSSLLLAPFEIPESIYTIEDIECQFFNRETFSFSKVLTRELKGSIYDYKVLVETVGGELREIPKRELRHLTHKKIWIEVFLNPDPNNGVIPLLRRVDLLIKRE